LIPLSRLLPWREGGGRRGLAGGPRAQRGGAGDTGLLRGSPGQCGLEGSPGMEGALGHRETVLVPPPGTVRRVTWARLSPCARPPLAFLFSWVKGEDGFLTGWVNAEFPMKSVLFCCLSKLLLRQVFRLSCGNQSC